MQAPALASKLRLNKFATSSRLSNQRVLATLVMVLHSVETFKNTTSPISL